MIYWMHTDCDNIKEILSNYTFEKTINKKKIKNEYENDSIISLDIETSTGFIDKENDIPICYHKGESDSYWNQKKPVSCVYIWMININGYTFYGRHLEELKIFMDLIFEENTHYIIYIHNAAFDLQFLQNVLPLEDVFARSERKTMKAFYRNIEFRCSYILTNLSLASWGKKIGLPKMVGDLDYNIIRTPLTELTETELGYCQRDVEVMYEGLKKYKDKYGHIKDIPLTQTGEIRKVIKEKIMKNQSLHKRIIKLLPNDFEMYKNLKSAFQGGYTHANSFYVGQVIEGIGEHFDFASSYPSVMCSEKFPMTPFEEAKFIESKTDKFAYLMLVEYENIECVTCNRYISRNKCIELSKNYNVDNGRIISADKLQIWITEQDYFIIKESYRYKMKILKSYISRKEYLPQEIVEYVLELYANKTQYKDVQGYEDIYNQSKQFINSMFGMCVTDLICDEVLYENGGWDTQLMTPTDVDKRLIELREWKNRGRVFLSYAWGVWITAYARRNLWRCILKNDFNVIYCDTDSIFIQGKGNDFTWYNDLITQKLKKCCEYYNLDFNLTRPKTPKGKEKPLGIFAPEEDWSEFVTLGAKRYCFRSVEDEKLHLTVSGINKEAVSILNDNIENFNDALIFDKDYKDVKKRIRFYIDNGEYVNWGDGYFSNYKYGIALRPTSYSMSMTMDFINLIIQESVSRDYLKCIVSINE